MTQETKALVLQSLQNLRGDDLHRAHAAFARCTPEQMNQPYGSSGQTRQQILDGYEIHAKRIDAAIAEVRAL